MAKTTNGEMIVALAPTEEMAAAMMAEFKEAATPRDALAILGGRGLVALHSGAQADLERLIVLHPDAQIWAGARRVVAEIPKPQLMFRPFAAPAGGEKSAKKPTRKPARTESDVREGIEAAKARFDSAVASGGNLSNPYRKNSREGRAWAQWLARHEEAIKAAAHK